MIRNPQPSTLRRFFTSRLFLVVIFCVIALIIFGFIRTYYQDYKVKQEIANLQKEVDNLQKKKFQSMELLEYVTSDAFVEEKARTELNLKKPGENVLIIPNTAKTTSESEVVPVLSESGQKLSNPIKWWYYFIHRSLP